MDDREWDTDAWRADCGKIASELGWRPRVALEEGLTRTAQWLQSEPSRLSGYRREGGVVSDGGSP